MGNQVKSTNSGLTPSNNVVDSLLRPSMGNQVKSTNSGLTPSNNGVAFLHTFAKKILMSDENEFLFKEYSEAASKFDYFLAGFLGAVSAYFIQNLATFSFGWNGQTVQFFGVLCILLSLAAALIRIERYVTIARITYGIYTKQKYLTLLAERRPPHPVTDPDTGQQYSENEILDKLIKEKAAIAKGKENRKQLFTRAGTAYKWRNWLMTAGLIVIIISKFLK